MSEEEGNGACGLLPQSGTVQGQPRFKWKGASLCLLVEELQGPAAESMDVGRPGTLGPQTTHPRTLYTLLAEGWALIPSPPSVLQLSWEPSQGRRFSLPQGYRDSILSLLSGLSRLSLPSPHPMLATTQESPASGRRRVDFPSESPVGGGCSWVEGATAARALVGLALKSAAKPISSLLCLSPLAKGLWVFSPR